MLLLELNNTTKQKELSLMATSNPRVWEFCEEIVYNSDESIVTHRRILKRNFAVYSECTFTKNIDDVHNIYEYVSDKQFHGDKNHHKHWVNKIKKRYFLSSGLGSIYKRKTPVK